MGSVSGRSSRLIWLTCACKHVNTANLVSTVVCHLSLCDARLLVAQKLCNCVSSKDTDRRPFAVSGKVEGNLPATLPVSEMLCRVLVPAGMCTTVRTLYAYVSKMAHPSVKCCPHS